MYPGTYAKSTPDKPAVIMAGSNQVLTYAQLNADSIRMAKLFRSAGLKVGDRVAIAMANEPNFLVACWAARRIGLYYVPINWHLTLPEMAYIVDNSRAAALIVGAEFSEIGTELRRQSHSVRLCLSVGTSIDGFMEMDEALAEFNTEELEDETSGDDMIYTSGTTGHPKGGWKALRGVNPADDGQHGMMMTAMFGLDAESRYLTPGAPLYHAAPLRFVLAATQLGATNVLMDRFDPQAALAAIDQHSVTHSQWVPTMFVRMLRLPEETRSRYELGSHKLALHSGAPCAISVKEQMIEWWGPILHEYYGASEGGGLSMISSTEWLEHRGSVGRASMGAFHILDEDGLELPAHDVGVVYSEGGLPIEYFDDPTKTELAHSKAGWSTVGDMGYLDEEGFLYLTDRKDHMIISGGVNVYPQEAENILIEHPQVADVAVIGVPNDDLGEEVKAVVRLVDPAAAGDPLADELITFCRSRLAHYKCPRTVDFVEDLPRAPSGKLFKRHLRDQYWPSPERQAGR